MAAGTPGERLTDVIYANKMTKKAFARALGYNPSYITQLCNNQKPPAHSFATRLELRFGVPAEWLIHGTQTDAGFFVQPQTPTVSRLRETAMSKIRRMDSEYELRAVLAFMNSYEELSAPEMSRKLRSFPEVPAVRLYSVPLKGEVAGGAPIIAYEARGETVETPISADSALILRGKSMEPDYPDGSLLLIKENAFVTNGDVVIALIMKEAEVAEATCKVYKKRGRKITLSPLNTDFNEQVYTATGGYEIRIFGKVIGLA